MSEAPAAWLMLGGGGGGGGIKGACRPVPALHLELQVHRLSITIKKEDDVPTDHANLVAPGAQGPRGTQSPHVGTHIKREVLVELTTRQVELQARPASEACVCRCP